MRWQEHFAALCLALSTVQECSCENINRGNRVALCFKTQELSVFHCEAIIVRRYSFGDWWPQAQPTQLLAMTKKALLLLQSNQAVATVPRDDAPERTARACCTCTGTWKSISTNLSQKN
jgi:hypothetical protein